MGEGELLVFQAKGIYHYLKKRLDLVMLIGTSFGGTLMLLGLHLSSRWQEHLLDCSAAWESSGPSQT